MKKFILAFMIVTTPGLIASTITKSDILATIQHQRELVRQSIRDAEIAKQELAVVQDAINSQTAKLHETEQQLAVVKKERDDARRHLHILALLCATLVGLSVASFIQRFSSVLLAFYPPALAANGLISIGAGIVAGSAAWLLLEHL